MEYNFKQTVNGLDYQFITDSECFSPKRIDTGTLALLSVAVVPVGGKVLDLGCGYGVVGIISAKQTGSENVLMSDTSEKALELTRLNAKLNGVGEINAILSRGFSNISENAFDLILSNPPYHTDFSVPKEFIENGYRRLCDGGKMLMVTKRREWYKKKFIAVFGGVKIHSIGEYFVFEAEKRSGQLRRKSGGSE